MTCEVEEVPMCKAAVSYERLGPNAAKRKVNKLTWKTCARDVSAVQSFLRVLTQMSPLLATLGW